MHRANETRYLRVQAPGSVAEQMGCAVVLIRHLNKMQGQKSGHRGMGSVDFQAAARSVLLVGRTKEDPQLRIVVPDKSSLAPEGESIFSLCTAGKGPSQIARQLTAEQVLNPSNYYFRRTGAALCGLDTSQPCRWSGASVAHILDNIVYRGHTLGLRTTTVSYKNKAEVKRPESEQALVENTHEPLVSQELWEIVREVRRHKRRAPKHMEEPGLFSGLVYCADCGGYLVLCRTEKMREEQYYFRCSTYGKKGKAFCTPHQILERDLKAIVLDDLKRVTHFARKKERQFAEYIQQKNNAQLRREISRLQKELDAGKKRCGELSALFKRLYEDNVLGRVTNEQFRMLSTDYNAEQKALKEAIPGWRPGWKNCGLLSPTWRPSLRRSSGTPP